MDWGRRWLIDLNAGKTQLVLFDQFNNTGAIDVKMDGSVLRAELKVCLRIPFTYVTVNLD